MLNWVLLMSHGTKSNLRSWRVFVKEECWTVTHLTQVKQCLTSFTVHGYVTTLFFALGRILGDLKVLGIS